MFVGDLHLRNTRVYHLQYSKLLISTKYCNEVLATRRDIPLTPTDVQFTRSQRIP